ncbi:Hsp20/alpha crystallin family protein [Larkinella rosea]|uniref:Hsp20/alpha crystallin family protein n=1 Tax=Larkinella rosea TaxID=2025312 RepID=A0A3P1BTK1_9BACT|nr:Hsp20/alpha crystallin family protein [Larkinella rosea]RRB04352.1 Hsp20/alpha crystallin family protein [Larkinella rosea]
MRTLVHYNQLPSFFNNLVTSEFNRHFNASGDKTAHSAVPAVNVKEDETAYHIELAAPGLKKEDFAINLTNNQLTISAKVETSEEEKTENYTRKEFSFNSFERSFRLPKNVNNEQIQAAYTDGILKINLPKVEKPVIEPKQIAIA